MGVVANALFCSMVSAGSRWPDCDEMTTPDPPWARALSFRGSPQGAWSLWTLNRSFGFVQTGPGLNNPR